MFFLWQRNCKQYQDKQFLTYFRCESQRFVLHSVKLPLVQIKSVIKNAIRRTSFSFLLPNIKAGVSVEAVMVMPLLVFLVLNLFSVIEMLRFHGNVAWALNKVGGELAVYGYAQEVLGEEWYTGVLEDVAISYLYVKEKIIETLGEEYVRSAPLSKGTSEILFSKAEILEDDCINLTVTYRLKMPFWPESLGEIRVYNCYNARAWTGYNVSGAKGASIVYVTEQGTVYHKTLNCPSLVIKKQKVKREDVPTLRNQYGEKYTACEYCSKGDACYLWIPEDGNKYHEKEDCSALKRTVTEVSEEQAREKGYETCKRCRAE